LPNYARVPRSSRGPAVNKNRTNGGDVEVDDRHAKTPLLWVLRRSNGVKTLRSAGPGSGAESLNTKEEK